MKRRYLLLAARSVIMLLAILLWMVLPLSHAAAQSQLILVFPPTPCDSLYCDSIVVSNGQSATVDLVALRWRDSLSYMIGPELGMPASIAGHDSLSVPICFRPNRRGKITDSLMIVVRGSTRLDTIYYRVTGVGIGPELDADPIVLNFPKTNPPATATMTMWIRNNGERPYDLTADELTIPPPFYLLSVLPQVVPAMDSIPIQFEFKPVVRGIYSFPIDIPAGCLRTLQIALNGSTDLVGTGAVLRASKFLFNPVNNEQTPCGTTQCTDLTISNVGNAPLSIDSIGWAIGTLGYKIIPTPDVPFLVPPNTDEKLHICFDGQRRGKLQDTLVIVNNNRNPIAFGLIIDVSGSMDFTLDCHGGATKRITQAIIQGQNFIGNTLLYIPSISLQDQIAISTFTTVSPVRGSPPLIKHIFPLTPVTDTVRTLAQMSLNGLQANGGTPTGAALIQMMDTIAKSSLSDRVIVLLTDGDADDTTTKATTGPALAARAAERGIKIFSIGIGLDAVGKRYLNALATGTGGATFDASDCSNLQSGFEQITDIISRGSIHREPFSMSVTAPALVTAKTIEFDSTLVGEDTCQTVVLSNVGEGTAQVTSPSDISFTDEQGNPITDFSVQEGTTFPLLIPEADRASITICFKPTVIRSRHAVAHVKYNNCGDDRLEPALDGAGYAYANLRIDDQKVGLPGDLVTLPVYLDTALTTYGVNTVTYRLTWDATMLELRGVTNGQALSSGGTVALSGPVAISGNRATAEIIATGQQIVGPGALANLEFEVLRGDSLGSYVELTSGTFEDGNPRAKLANAGLIAFDSTCFRSSKPIRYLSPSGKITAGEITPTPTVGGPFTLPVDLTEDAHVDVTIYTLGGSAASKPYAQTLPAGHAAITISVEALPAGDYYAVVRTNTGATLVRKLTIVR